MVQEAIIDANKEGLRGICSGAESSRDELSSVASGDAGELEARRVSSFWLGKYLSPEQLNATACLSVFAASFDASGAESCCMAHQLVRSSKLTLS